MALYAEEQNGYGAAPYQAHAYDPYGHHAPAYPSSYGHHGGYYRKSFPPPRPVIDPKYYRTVLSGFQQCVQHKCDALPRAYTTTAEESLATVGGYTACVTSCAASEVIRVCLDLKGLLAKIFDIGVSHLATAHKYLAGEGEFDVLGNNTHIDSSCCLPNDYFVDWSKLVMAISMKFGDSEDVRLVSVEEYVNFCIQKREDPVQKYLGKFDFLCSDDTIAYFLKMQTNIGHLILAPKCQTLAPEGSCDDTLVANPRAVGFGQDICIAHECVEEGAKQLLTVPIIKYPVDAMTYAESCEDEEHDTYTLKFRRVPHSKVDFYTVIEGLPSLRTEGVMLLADELQDPEGDCEYEQGLVTVNEENGQFEEIDFPDDAEVEAISSCPSTGLFEYCHVKQYVNWLQTQLFDLGGCPIVDMKDQEVGDAPYAYYTLACLYRVVSLKCDCMEAVLNCYQHEYHFMTGLGKTLGKAASVMCGFILCQKPAVYSLLGGQAAIERANIMRAVLLEVGAMEIAPAGVPAATFAFLSFGLGMVAFVVTKAALRSSKSVVAVEDGYRNLI